MLALLVSGYISAENVSEVSMMPKALLDLGMNNKAYFILIGTLIGMLPTVLDSLLVTIIRITFRAKREYYTE